MIIIISIDYCNHYQHIIIIWVIYCTVFDLLRLRLADICEYPTEKNSADSSYPWHDRFYQGRRSTDDDRQVGRGNGVIGASGRWRNNLANKVLASGEHLLYLIEFISSEMFEMNNRVPSFWGTEKVVLSNVCMFGKLIWMASLTWILIEVL